MRREQAKLIKDVVDPMGQKLRDELEQLQKGATTRLAKNTVIMFGEAIRSRCKLAEVARRMPAMKPVDSMSAGNPRPQKR